MIIWDGYTDDNDRGCCVLVMMSIVLNGYYDAIW